MITDALCSGSSYVQRAGTQIQPHVKPFRDAVRSLIPASFKWWVELDDDIGFSIRWFWMGHAAVSYIGRVQDVDPSIMLSLLSVVDWEDEVGRAIQSVEAYEAELLTIAQSNRRNRLTDSNLAPIEMPPPGPLSVEAKKQLSRARYVQGIKYREFITEPARILMIPSDHELANDRRMKDEDDFKRSLRLERVQGVARKAFKSSLSPSQIEDMIVTASRRKKPLFTRKGGTQ